MTLEQMAAIDVVDRNAEAIWAHVRENANSLDSERACKMIRDTVDAATSELRALLDESANKLAAIQAVLKPPRARKSKRDVDATTTEAIA